jgi:hypothetical protein
MRIFITRTVCCLLVNAGLAGEIGAWQAEMLPIEHEVAQDRESGVRLVFVTTASSMDQNLYFHQRSWLADESILLFRSDRTGRSELFGYVEATGELARFTTEGELPIGSVTCARRGNRIFGLRGHTVVAWTVAVKTEDGESEVTLRERKIAELPKNHAIRGGLSENADGRFLALAYRDTAAEFPQHIVAIEIETGKIVPIATVDFPVSHIQFSWSRPDLIMFARSYPEGDRMAKPTDPDAPPNYRLWHIDFSGRPPWPLYPQKPDELVTHECWWTEDRFTFTGAHHVPDESHVKVYDLKTKRISIIGAGSWWPKGSAAQISQRAWWHAAGSPNGRWVVADTFHGNLAIFDAHTTEERTLTTAHRRYGQKNQAHPHPGWAPASDRVVFTSNQKGNPDVVIAHLPKAWN